MYVLCDSETSYISLALSGLTIVANEGKFAKGNNGSHQIDKGVGF
jgi:hypothetical protein